MINLTRALAITVTLCSTTTIAKPIESSCLKETSQSAGKQKGEYRSNAQSVIGKPEETRLHSVTTCHSGNQIRGVQLKVELPADTSEAGQVFSLDPIGDISGDCDTMLTPEGVDEIVATISKRTSGISFQKGQNDIKETYGQLDQHGQTKWSFDSEDPLIGLFGRTD